MPSCVRPSLSDGSWTRGNMASLGRWNDQVERANDLWLDGVASVCDISHNPAGPVTASFKFKDGEEHQASIVALNRVLYVKGQFGSSQVSGLSDDAPEAFDVAERIRGLEWVRGREFDFGGMMLPGVGVRGGYNEFLRVYWFGKRMRSVIGAPGADSLVSRLLAGD